MSAAGFETAIPASERLQTHALDGAATGNSFQFYIKDKVTPLQARLWPRGRRVIALLFQDLGARRG